MPRGGRRTEEQRSDGLAGHVQPEQAWRRSTRCPTARPDGDGLTARQRLVLETIRSSVESRGYPPSMREIGEAVGLTSPSSVKHQLTALERKGYLRRDPNRPRAIEVVHAGRLARRRAPGRRRTAAARASTRPGRTGERRARRPSYVPVVGRIAAGGPILAEQVVEDVFPLPRQLVGDGDLFLLKVSGDSMIDAAICDGDWVVVRRQPVAENGEIVAAMIDGEATVKTLQARRRPRVAPAAQRGLRADPGRRRPRSSAASSACCAASEPRARRSAAAPAVDAVAARSQPVAARPASRRGLRATPKPSVGRPRAPRPPSGAARRARRRTCGTSSRSPTPLRADDRRAPTGTRR